MADEIDFLPEWYKSSRRRKMSYRRQYVVMGVFLMVLLVLHFVVTRSVAKATAQVAAEAPMVFEAERKLARFADIKNEMKVFQNRAKVIDELDSKIRVGSVLAEMSHLIDERIVLGNVEFVAESYQTERKKTSGGTASTITIAKNQPDKKSRMFKGDVRFKLILRGVAAAAGDVATLVCRLEDSPCFCQVTPLFSRDKQITTRSGGGKTGGKNANTLDVSEFEIRCYLANYAVNDESKTKLLTGNVQQ